MFALGTIFAARWPAMSAISLLVAVLVVAALSVLISWRAPGWAVLLALLGFLVGGMAVAKYRSRTIGFASQGTQLLEGEVVDPPKTTNGRTRFLLQVNKAWRQKQWQSVRFQAWFTVESMELLPGDRIRLRALLNPPPLDFNPGANSPNDEWRSRGIVAWGTVVERQIVILGELPSYRRALNRLRERFGELIDAAVPNSDAAALIRALAIGDRGSLSGEINDDFNASGLAHILSVSGLHITVVAMGLYRLLRWCWSRSARLLTLVSGRALAGLVAIPATWAYVIVTGSEVPAVRSGIMTSAMFAAMTLGRDADTVSALAVALLAVLTYDPASVHAISFQLSFGAVAGLMLLTGPLRALIALPRPDGARSGLKGLAVRAWEAVLQAGAGSLAASLATAPLIAATFHRASLVAVLANIAALPVASALTVASVLSAVGFVLGVTPAILGIMLADPLAKALLYISHTFASLPHASLMVPSPSALGILAWYGALLALFARRHRRRPAMGVFCCSVAVLALLWMVRVTRPWLSQALVVTFLAVGQGDAALLQFPGGKNLLIDGGGDPAGGYDPGERVVVPALVELGAMHLSAVVVSHPHPDHARGLIAVLKRLSVDELWIAAPTERDALLNELLALAQAKGIRVRELVDGERLTGFGPTTVEVLHPRREDQGLLANDASLVLRVAWGKVSFLFPGDIERNGEEALLAMPRDLRASVLKAPHHGSKTSSSAGFIERVQPQQVVFSVGRNRFGFPHQSVVERYVQNGCVIHRTDEEGAITFRTDGQNLQVQTYAKVRLE